MFAAPAAAQRSREPVRTAVRRSPAADSAYHPRNHPVTGAKPSAVPVVDATVRSSGEALDSFVRLAMEDRFGRDFANVRVHTDGLAQRSATELNANAYTVGEHLIFNRDRYRPAETSGRRLIAHELAHVVQQSSPTRSNTAPTQLEREANRAGHDISHGRRPQIIGGLPRFTVQRQAASTLEPTESIESTESIPPTPAPSQTPTVGSPAANPPAPAPPVPAAVQAANNEAAESMRRLNATVTALLASKNETERNTGGLFTGTPPRIAYTTMTLRTDSEQLRVALARPPGTSAFFFVGPTQSPWDGNAAHWPANTIEHQPTTLGTIDDTAKPPKIIVRGKGPDGGWRSQDQLKTTFVHESSHILVASYGELPQTVSSASFDRYQDEFRAYWVADYANLPLADRWKAIRRHIVGENPNEGTYPDLKTPYWAKDAAGNWANPAFRAQIDGHHAPTGFNLSNSPRLDALFTALGQAAADPTKTDAAILTVLQLTPAERAEARSANVIKTLVARLPDGPAIRIRDALSTPVNPDYTRQIGEVRGPRVTAFLTACALNNEASIKAAYATLTAAEKRSISSNAAVDVFLDHHLPNVKQRAAVYAMVVSMDIGQYDVMTAFLLECLDTLVNSVGKPPAAPSPALMALAKQLTLASRLSLYALNKQARAVFVDPLPEPVLRVVGPIIRGDRDA